VKYIRKLIINQQLNFKELSNIKIDKLESDFKDFLLDDLLNFYEDYLKFNIDKNNSLTKDFGLALNRICINYKRQKTDKTLNELLMIVYKTNSMIFQEFLLQGYKAEERLFELEEHIFKSDLMMAYSYLRSISRNNPSLLLDFSLDVYNNLEKKIYTERRSEIPYINDILKKYLEVKYKDKYDVSKDGMDIIQKEHPVVYDFILDNKNNNRNPVYTSYLKLSDKKLPPELEEDLFIRTNASPLVILNYVLNNIKERDFDFESQYLFNDKRRIEVSLAMDYINQLIFDSVLENKEIKNYETLNDEFKLNDLYKKTEKIDFNKITFINNIVKRNLETIKKFTTNYNEIVDFFELNFRKQYYEYMSTSQDLDEIFS
jgi:hypothetical protein